MKSIPNTWSFQNQDWYEELHYYEIYKEFEFHMETLRKRYGEYINLFICPLHTEAALKNSESLIDGVNMYDFILRVYPSLKIYTKKEN